MVAQRKRSPELRRIRRNDWYALVRIGTGAESVSAAPTEADRGELVRLLRRAQYLANYAAGEKRSTASVISPSMPSARSRATSAASFTV